jgi:hypothetical protein
VRSICIIMVSTAKSVATPSAYSLAGYSIGATVSRSSTVRETEGHRDMSNTESVATTQRAFWNSEATRRWITEQTRIGPAPGRPFRDIPVTNFQPPLVGCGVAEAVLF